MALPNGLKFIMGFNMNTGVKPDNMKVWWGCDGPTGINDHYETMGDALAHCPAGNRLGATALSPPCWDGQNLDNATDHRSHLSYQSGTIGNSCPADHPYLIPAFTLSAWWSILPSDTPQDWTLSSDSMFPNLPHGYTFHTDWFGAWDPTTMATWTDNCINKMLSCTGGDLGNGTQMKGAMQPSYGFVTNPQHLVPVPAGGMTM